MSTVESTGATVRICFRTDFIAALSPSIPSGQRSMPFSPASALARPLAERGPKADWLTSITLEYIVRSNSLGQDLLPRLKAAPGHWSETRPQTPLQAIDCRAQSWQPLR